MKEKKNTTISAQNLQRAERIMKLRGFDDYSEFVSALIREEWERRQGPVVFRDAGAIEPPTPPTKPVNYHPSKKDNDRKALELVKAAAAKKLRHPAAPRTPPTK